MLESMMIATAERDLRRQRELRRDPASARQAIRKRRATTTTGGAPPGKRPTSSAAAPLRILVRLRLRMY